MKIGIMTFWWSNDNYGQLLQCYALQKFLSNIGHEPFLIKYNYEKDVASPLYIKAIKALNPVRLLKYINKKIHKSLVRREENLSSRDFDKFRTKYIKQEAFEYSSWKQLKSNPPEADAYIVGSDQVWRFSPSVTNSNKGMIHSYMLDFGSCSTKRLSYAASWGLDFLSKELIDEINPLLKKFDYVSVREQNGIELCKQCGVSNAEWVADPTMLLTPEVYRDLYKTELQSIRMPKEKFLYMLNNKSDFDIEKVYSFAEEKKLKVIYVTGNGVINKKEKFFATIPEWLYLIDNAEYVVTNSFHCGVFSTLFNKKYGIVGLTGIHKGMNKRIDSLFERFNISPRYINESLNILDVDYKADLKYNIENFQKSLESF